MKHASVIKTLLCALVLVCLLLVGCQPETTPDQPDEQPTLADKYQHISISEAITIATNAGETPTTETYTIVGTVESVSNAMYGEMTVADETGSMQRLRLYLA